MSKIIEKKPYKNQASHNYKKHIRIFVNESWIYAFVISLIDSGADLNYINEEIIPSKYLEKPT